MLVFRYRLGPFRCHDVRHATDVPSLLDGLSPAPPWRSVAGTGGCSVHTCAECLLNRCPPGFLVLLASPLLTATCATLTP